MSKLDVPRPAHYFSPSERNTLILPVSMREVAEAVDQSAYGLHQFLSHIIDLRREEVAERIARYRDSGDHDVAEYAERKGDEMADGLERLLNEGCY